MSAPRGVRLEDYWRRLFEYRARIRDDDAGIAGWSESGLATRFRLFQRLWQAERATSGASGHWMDAGCGAGTYSRFLASQSLRVTAFDYSQLSTHKARQRSAADIDWVVADATCLPFASASMDGALCFGVMQALSTPHRALAELRRVLRPGGELWVDALNGQCLPNAAARAWRLVRGTSKHLRYDSVPDFVEALHASGFTDVRTQWLPVMPERLRFAQPLAEGTAARRLMQVPPLGTWGSHSFVAIARAGHTA